MPRTPGIKKAFSSNKRNYYILINIILGLLKFRQITLEIDVTESPGFQFAWYFWVIILFVLSLTITVFSSVTFDHLHVNPALSSSMFHSTIEFSLIEFSLVYVSHKKTKTTTTKKKQFNSTCLRKRKRSIQMNSSGYRKTNPAESNAGGLEKKHIS